ncbi:MAG: GNAT family N-acetyltransferase [Thermoleophilia bacterium]
MTEPTQSDTPAVRFNYATSLSSNDVDRWRAFARRVPWAHYKQDPSWAEVVCSPEADGSRQPVFFTVERDGELCLTALGIRRRVPVPGRVFWEFEKGPVFADNDALEAWLNFLLARVGHEAARLRLAPSMPLAEGGDEVETILERAGFTRRRMLGGWATLCVGLEAEENEIFRSFRSATQRAVRKSQRLGVSVAIDDTAGGWAVLAALETELSQHSPVSAVSPDTIAQISRTWLRHGAGGTVMVAHHDGRPLAAALLIIDGLTAHLPLIPSSRRVRDLPASHLLVWEAARWARRHGCTRLDLDGYSLVARPGEALWGINQFKRGFASLDNLTRSVAIHERIGSPLVVASADAVREAQGRWQHWLRARETARNEAANDVRERTRPEESA